MYVCLIKMKFLSTLQTNACVFYLTLKANFKIKCFNLQTLILYLHRLYRPCCTDRVLVSKKRMHNYQNLHFHAGLHNISKNHEYRQALEGASLLETVRAQHRKPFHSVVNWCTRWGNLAGGALGQSSVGKLKRPVIPKVKTLMKMITNYKTSRKYYINFYVLMDIMIYNIYYF